MRVAWDVLRVAKGADGTQPGLRWSRHPAATDGSPFRPLRSLSVTVDPTLVRAHSPQSPNGGAADAHERGVAVRCQRRDPNTCRVIRAGQEGADVAGRRPAPPGQLRYPARQVGAQRKPAPWK